MKSSKIKYLLVCFIFLLIINPCPGQTQKLFKGIIAAIETAYIDPERRNIYFNHIVTIDSTGKKRYLTDKLDNYSDLSFSPDSKKILYCINRDTIIYNLGGLKLPGLKKLGNEIFDDTEYPKPSKDGKGFIFLVTDIWIMNSNGTNKYKLSKSREFTNIQRPRWSPDGKRIIYTSHEIFGIPEGEIWQMDLQTKHEEKIEVDLGSYSQEGQSLLYPDYSPDGRYIIFSKILHGKNYADIFIKDLISNNVYLFYNQMPIIINFNWSPNSERILIQFNDIITHKIYFSNRIHVLDFYFLGQLGLKKYLKEELKKGNISLGVYDWSPDGEEIVLVINRGKNQELWIFDKDFQDPRKLIEMQNISGLSWGGYPRPPFTGKIEIAGTKIVGKNRLIVTVYFVPLLFVLYIIYNKKIKRKLKREQTYLKKDLERSRKDLMLLLRDFDHTGIATKIIVNMAFCFKNILSKGDIDNELVRELKDLIKNYKLNVDTSINKIIELGKRILLSIEKLTKIENINSKIIKELDKLRDEDFIRNIDELYLHDLHYLVEALQLNCRFIAEDLNKYFKTDILEICKSIISLTEKSLENNIKFTLNYKELREKAAVISKNDLTFVIENLISNSVKALENSDHKSITITLVSDERKIFFEITDSGCGIERKNWENIFLGITDDPTNKGYGLMRSIQLLNIYGGILRVKESELNRGTTMLLMLKVNNS